AEYRLDPRSIDHRIVPDQRCLGIFAAGDGVCVERSDLAAIAAGQDGEVGCLRRQGGGRLAQGGPQSVGRFLRRLVGATAPGEQGQSQERAGAPHPARTSVPAPRLVKNSSSIACGTRPSRTTAASHPASTAFTQVSSFGIMPPLIVPSWRRLAMSAGVRSVSRPPFLSSTPATSVRRNSRAAPSAAAIAPAIVSALML